MAARWALGDRWCRELQAVVRPPVGRLARATRPVWPRRMGHTEFVLKATHQTPTQRTSRKAGDDDQSHGGTPNDFPSFPPFMDLYDTTQLALNRAMAGTALRQAAISNNLANADTPATSARTSTSTAP